MRKYIYKLKDIKNLDKELCKFMKICKDCGVLELMINFGKAKSCRDNRRNTCKKCTSEYNKKYAKDNKEIILKRSRDYHHNNREKVAEYKKKYYEENKERVIKYKKKYYEENKEKISKHHKQYREGNKDKIREINKNYYTNNKDKIIEYRENNKEKIQKQKRRYSEEHKEEISNKRKEYYKENSEKFKEYSKEYRKENSEKIKEYKKQYKNQKVQEALQQIKTEVEKEPEKYNYIEGKEIYGVIYLVCNIKSDRYYVGQTTVGFDNRYNKGWLHDHDYKDTVKGDLELYGKESFKFTKLFKVAHSQYELDKLEAYYIDYYDSYENGYNENRGNIFTDRGKEKII